MSKFVGERMQAGIEQRKYRRYNLSLPVQLRPAGPPGQSAKAIETQSTDISAHGIHILLSEEIDVGSELKLEIALPAIFAGSEGVRVRCKAKVARVERKDTEGKIGVGANIECYEFVQQPKNPAGRTGS